MKNKNFPNAIFVKFNAEIIILHANLIIRFQILAIGLVAIAAKPNYLILLIVVLLKSIVNYVLSEN